MQEGMTFTIGVTFAFVPVFVIEVDMSVGNFIFDLLYIYVV